MKRITRQLKNNSGFTLVEVLISMFILSIIVTCTCTAFVYATRISKENRLSMTSINLANESIEYIRSLEFVEVGTKDDTGGVVTYGDPAGEILQITTKTVDMTDYKIYTSINWEEEGDWDDLGAANWDYKSVRVTVVPKDREGDATLTKVIETYVTRDYAQPGIPGGNIRIRLIRGWNPVSGAKTPVVNAKVIITSPASAPRQVYTSSKGAARFINLTSGTYTVNFDPSGLGMMMYPRDDWATNITNNTPPTEEFKAEYPCHLRIKLMDHLGNPVTIATGTIGKISISVPYGSNIDKDMEASQVDAQGRLPQDFITGLWPVGIGYSGAYLISNAWVPGYLYLGNIEGSGASEGPWDGTFDGPGTYKEITCKLLPYPSTPSYINTAWVTDTNIIAGSHISNIENVDGTWDIIEGKFNSSNLTETVIMPINTTSHFNATSIFFENTGIESTQGLYIDQRTELVLHTGVVVFRGKVEIRDANALNIGKITLRTTYEDGSLAPTVDGSEIGAIAGVSYGRLYLTKPLVIGDVTKLEPGGYYYYDGLTIPNTIDNYGLISIDMDNYIE